MKLQIRYFASIREVLGEGESITFPMEAYSVPAATVGGLRDWLCTRSTAHAQVLARGRAVRAAFEQQLCSDDQPLRDGAEVAFFPPVTGG